jgi:colanic acid/amylovoran biosynthesis glycosyltransferase
VRAGQRLYRCRLPGERGECSKSIDDRGERFGLRSTRVTSRRPIHMERELPLRDLDPAAAQSTSKLRVAWIMSRFPRLTETFVLYEILAAEALGLSVDVYPLLRERAKVVHPEAQEMLGRVQYKPFLSWGIIASQLYWLARAPRSYLGALWALVRGAWGSANFLIGGLATFPKVAHMARGMRANGVEHVHCHFANHPALAGFVIQRLTGITYSFTVHGSDIYVDRHMLSRKVAEAAFVIAVSEYARSLILEECGEAFQAKIRVVHCGVDVEVFVPNADRVMSADLSIVCVATLSPWKGQEQLIEACRLLTERGVEIRCLLVGGGGDRDALQRRIVDAGVADRVQIAHWKTRPEVARLIREADVVVAPSVPMRSGKQEGIPVTLMEAMASGIPVVASRLGGIPELISDEQTGLLVAPGDPAGLADALGRLQASPELRRRLAEAGRERVLRDFELRSNAAEVVRQIKAVAQKGS